MKRIKKPYIRVNLIFGLLLLVYSAGCMTAKEQANLGRNIPLPDSLFETTSKKKDYDPCKDSLYLSLKKIKLDSMSTREYEYYLSKEKECAEYNKVLLQNEPAEKLADQYSSNSGVWIGLAIISLVISIYWILQLNN